MSSAGLHPLARQGLVASQLPDCSGWARGMTKYLAHDSPEKCIKWARDFFALRLLAVRECDEVVLQGNQFLLDVLENPSAATLTAIERRARRIWDHRTQSDCAGALARLLWAALGAADLAQAKQGLVPEPAQMLPSDETRAERSLGLVWDQSAIAIQMAAFDGYGCLIAAQSFTRLVCFPERPANCKTLDRYEWAWNEIAYDVSVLRQEDDFYIEFCDRTDEVILFSGPFADREVVDRRIAFLMHRPKIIQIIPHASIN